MQRPRRLAQIRGFGIDKVAAAAGDDPDVLRLENLDTDLAPPPEAIAATCGRGPGRRDHRSARP